MANVLTFPELREQAIALRRAGKSRREIQQILQIRSNAQLNDVLHGEPPQPWTHRPNAKDDLHTRARELRGQGLGYEQIAAELGVSDPLLIRFYLRFLQAAGVTQDRLVFRVSIHDSADHAAAQAFWLQVTQADPTQFRKPSLKRHNPVTVRKNTDDDYHGCLRIDVLKGAILYRQIEGWASAVMTRRPMTVAGG